MNLDQSLIHDKYYKVDFWLYVLVLVMLNPVTSFGTSDYMLVAATLLLGIYIFFIKGEEIDNIIFWVLLYWCIINMLSFFLVKELGVEMKMSTFIGSILKIFIAYGLMKLAGIRFILWFYRITLILAIISIPFFIVQLVEPSFFYKIPFNFAYEDRANSGHWNGIIFNFSTFHLLQNSGFAGESGTFGYYIGLAMICNLILYEGRANRNFFILLVIGLTTTSTTYYITLLLFGMFFLSYTSWSTRMIYLVISIVFVVITFQLPFMGEKIYTYAEQTDDMLKSKELKLVRVNRVSTFLNHFNDVIHYPLGYGINDAQRTKNVFGDVVDGTNGMSRIAVMYGIFGFVFFTVSYFKLFRVLTFSHPGYPILVVIILMYIAANPMERDFVVIPLFWLYFILKNNEIEQSLQELRWHISNKKTYS
jgi:hypothetical protein